MATVGRGGGVPAAAEGADLLGRVQRYVTMATLVKTIIGMLFAVGIATLSVYKFFAKEFELQELACKVVEQNELNNDMITTSREIRGALKLLKENFESAPDKPISAAFMAKEISSAVEKIDASLSHIEQTRNSAAAMAIKKDYKC
jgi:hypothetical protein